METQTKFTEYQVQLANAYKLYLKTKQPIKAEQMEIFKDHFPALTQLLKSNPSRGVHDAVFKLCQRLADPTRQKEQQAFISSKHSLATLIYIEYCEAHGEDELIQRWIDQKREYVQAESINAFGFDIFKACEPDHEDDQQSDAINRKVAKLRTCPPREDVDMRSSAMMPNGEYMEELND